MFCPATAEILIFILPQQFLPATAVFLPQQFSCHSRYFNILTCRSSFSVAEVFSCQSGDSNSLSLDMALSLLFKGFGLRLALPAETLDF
jgi:hypothetical protein